MTLAKHAGDSKEALSQNKLALLLCMSVSEVNAGIKRLVLSRLLVPTSRNDRKEKTVFIPILQACEECLISGVKYFFPVRPGEYTTGIATGYAAPILAKHISPGSDPVHIWPSAYGDRRGLTIEPLYRSVPQSLIEHPDPLFYDLLALIDAIRCGRARERNLGAKLLKEKLHNETNLAD